jgi:predicted nucleic-acid-binding protein
VIGLDTNILVRYLAQDDPVQSPIATRLIENTLTENNPGFVSIVALAETVWVLKRTFKLTDEEIAARLRLILSIDALVVEHEQHVFTAMIALNDGHGAFSDVLIGLLGKWTGCSHTLTFDRKASRLPGFELLS